MSRTAALFREADVSRAVKGVLKAGLRVTGVKVGAGGIEILTAETAAASSVDSFEEWKARRDARRTQGH